MDVSHDRRLPPDDARGGVRVRPAESLLLDRARDFLAAGPADVKSLVERVCQMPGAPGPVAEHLAHTLLGPHPEFARDACGRWCLSATLPDALARVAAAADAAADELVRLPYVVVDVETTGGRPDSGDRVTEIAMVLVADGEVREVFETLVNPMRPIPPWITQLTNINWAMVKDAPRFSDVCGEITDRLRGRVFVAHNAPFDWRFVTAEVERSTGERLDGRRLCTVRLARKLLPQLPRRSLDYVARHYGVDIAARHRAAGDAVATAQVLLGLLRDAADRGATRWAELELLLAPSGATKRRRRPSALPRPAFGEGA